MAATRTRVTPEQYLALPDVEPPWLEYFRGEVIEKPLPNANHSYVAARLASRLDRYSESRGGSVHVEGRSRFEDTEEGLAYLLPDVSFYRAGTRRNVGAMLLPPTFAAEIVSPKQGPPHNDERVRFFLSHGVEEVWVIDPVARTAQVFDLERDGAVYAGGLLRSTALDGFEIDIAALFRGLDSDFA